MERSILFFPVAYGLKKGDDSQPDPIMEKVLDRLGFYYFSHNQNPLVVMTAGVVPHKGFVLSDVYRDYLNKLRVPSEVYPAERFNTDGEMEELARFLKNHPEIETVYVFNKSWHMPRVALLFWIHRKRFSVHVSVRYVSVQAADSKQIVREAIKLAKDLCNIFWRSLHSHR